MEGRGSGLGIHFHQWSSHTLCEMTPVPPAYYAHSTWSRTEEQRNIEACGNVLLVHRASHDIQLKWLNWSRTRNVVKWLKSLKWSKSMGVTCDQRLHLLDAVNHYCIIQYISDQRFWTIPSISPVFLWNVSSVIVIVSDSHFHPQLWAYQVLWYR